MSLGKLPIIAAAAIWVALLTSTPSAPAQACEMHGIWHQDCYPTPSDERDDHDDGVSTSVQGGDPLVAIWNAISNGVSDFFSAIKEGLDRPVREPRQRERETHVMEMWQKGYQAFGRGDYDEAAQNYCEALATLSSPAECNRSLNASSCYPGNQTYYCSLLRNLQTARAAKAEQEQKTIASNQRTLGYASPSRTAEGPFDVVIRTEPPSPRVTYPTTLTELREEVSVEKRWLIDHLKRALDYLPENSAERIRQSLFAPYTSIRFRMKMHKSS